MIPYIVNMSDLVKQLVPVVTKPISPILACWRSGWSRRPSGVRWFTVFKHGDFPWLCQTTRGYIKKNWTSSKLFHGCFINNLTGWTINRTLELTSKKKEQIELSIFLTGFDGLMLMGDVSWYIHGFHFCYKPNNIPASSLRKSKLVIRPTITGHEQKPYLPYPIYDWA